MEVYEAGFDLTGIDGDIWVRLMEKYGLTKAEDHEIETGWVWEGEAGLVVTACDPVSGEYRHYNTEPRPDWASYIGLSGGSEFVLGLFKDIKDNASYIKNENSTSRQYI